LLSVTCSNGSNKNLTHRDRDKDQDFKDKEEDYTYKDKEQVKEDL